MHITPRRNSFAMLLNVQRTAISQLTSNPVHPHRRLFQWTQTEGDPVHVAFPDLTQVTSRWAWVLKMDGATPVAAASDKENRL